MLQKGTEQHNIVPESRTLLCAMVPDMMSCPENISVLITELTQRIESETVDQDQPPVTMDKEAIIERDDVMMIRRHV
jgi:hypothetical protein